MINYIIATYAGNVKREFDIQKQCLQVQLENIYNKKSSLVKQITVVCPKVDNPIPNYYQKEKWLKKFQDKGIDIVFMDYKGENKHNSYDQYIQAYIAYPNFDYYIIMEDDYFMELKDYDTVLVDLHRKKFKNGIGYLCSKTLTGHAHGPIIASVSNGIISKNLFDLKNKNNDILNMYYKNKSYKGNPQIKFSYFLGNMNDYSKEYNVLFWNSSTKKVVRHSKKPISIISPVEILI